MTYGRFMLFAAATPLLLLLLFLVQLPLWLLLLLPLPLLLLCFQLAGLPLSCPRVRAAPGTAAASAAAAHPKTTGL
jgi:hypothetical protein